ncbi:hypothetical protein C2845_PM18G07540 [Panicum miliaceum]|uniref:Uncharacterized protein n=1 Tax=Panicum miliaceum TaxID=4540 RepID=A0A3L6PIA1_PANMI|nr:hypothetical protein C2845_PM18G07540 [Panicum miliaceum]
MLAHLLLAFHARPCLRDTAARARRSRLRDTTAHACRSLASASAAPPRPRPLVGTKLADDGRSRGFLAPTLPNGSEGLLQRSCTGGERRSCGSRARGKERQRRNCRRGRAQAPPGRTGRDREGAAPGWPHAGSGHGRGAAATWPRASKKPRRQPGRGRRAAAPPGGPPATSGGAAELAAGQKPLRVAGRGQGAAAAAEPDVGKERPRGRGAAPGRDGQRLGRDSWTAAGGFLAGRVRRRMGKVGEHLGRVGVGAGGGWSRGPTGETSHLRVRWSGDRTRERWQTSVIFWHCEGQKVISLTRICWKQPRSSFQDFKNPKSGLLEFGAEPGLFGSPHRF